ncbi:hypothetical protein ['Camptotheca acuminata' phytoplasma]|uniref:hypothetical protein n=1 Tax='Camptotheca acuminata' phytoplasma TaxID=3239192 RepID=UPI003519F495
MKLSIKFLQKYQKFIILLFLFSISSFLLMNYLIQNNSTPPQNINNLNFLNNSNVICLEKTDFPPIINPLKISNSYIREILDLLKQNFIDEQYELNTSNNLKNQITINIKPNLKFENNEIINNEHLQIHFKNLFR